MRHVMLAFGTRPEAIKMAPVIKALREAEGLRVSVTVTAQHRQMLDQALALFDIRPDHDLDLMRAGQSLPDLFARMLKGVSDIIGAERPDALLVHGDTSTTLAAALAAFYAKVPVGHVEAGLRTGNLEAPWPEEGNRRLVAPLARWHFAPTDRARKNLLAESVRNEDILVTGNTVIDALLDVWPIFEAFQLTYVSKGLLLEQEKNVSALSPNGPSAGATDTAKPARNSARTARRG